MVIPEASVGVKSQIITHYGLRCHFSLGRPGFA